MKIGSFLVAAMLAVSISSFSFADESKTEKKYKEGGCCATAKAKGEECKHPCCAKAEKDGGMCTKCNPEKK